MRPLSISSIFFVLLSAFFFQNLEAQNSPSKEYQVDKLLPDGTATISVTELSSPTKIQKQYQFNNIVIDGNVFTTNDPLNSIWSAQPNQDDIIKVLLERGLASIKDPASAPPVFLDAQATARKYHLGIWISEKDNVPVPAPPAPVEINHGAQQDAGGTTILPNKSTSSKGSVQDPTNQQSVVQIGSVVLLVLSAVGGIGGLLEAYYLIACFIASRTYRVLFLGPGSTGKTAVFLRLQNPDISPLELIRLQETLESHEGDFPDLEWGRGQKVKCKSIDIVGQTPEDINRIVGPKGGTLKRFASSLFPQKVVWIVCLSTTSKANVDFLSTNEMKFEESYISKQSGALRQLRGILLSGHYQEPIHIITLTTKLDLYLEHSPDEDPNQSQASLNHANECLKDHIDQLKTMAVAGNKKIPCESWVVSAVKNWHCTGLEKKIKLALTK